MNRAWVVLFACCLGACATEPTDDSLAGAWLARDTFEVRYTGDDALIHVFSYSNRYPVVVMFVDDTTLSFHVTGGTQIQSDSTAGAAAERDTVSSIEMDGEISIRGDTAFIDLLGKLPLNERDGPAFSSRRVLPLAECLNSIGPFIPTSPPPACIESHHWVR